MAREPEEFGRRGLPIGIKPAGGTMNGYHVIITALRQGGIAADSAGVRAAAVDLAGPLQGVADALPGSRIDQAATGAANAWTDQIERWSLVLPTSSTMRAQYPHRAGSRNCLHRLTIATAPEPIPDGNRSSRRSPSPTTQATHSIVIHYATRSSPPCSCSASRSQQPHAEPNPARRTECANQDPPESRPIRL